MYVARRPSARKPAPGNPARAPLPSLRRRLPARGFAYMPGWVTRVFKRQRRSSWPVDASGEEAGECGPPRSHGKVQALAHSWIVRPGPSPRAQPPSRPEVALAARAHRQRVGRRGGARPPAVVADLEEGPRKRPDPPVPIGRKAGPRDGSLPPEAPPPASITPPRKDKAAHGRAARRNHIPAPPSFAQSQAGPADVHKRKMLWLPYLRGLIESSHGG